MTTKTKESKQNRNLRLAQELKRLASDWVQTFNFIQVDVLKLVAEHEEHASLIEFIRQKEITFEDVAQYSKETAAELKRKYETVENCPEYETCHDEKQDNNYPMWNTCFEFKENVYEDILKTAMDAGFGIIENLGEFNQILFVAGAGYSFYGAHWIPLFLNLPWNADLKKKYKGVDYKMM